MTGDGEEAREEELLRDANLDVDVLLVGRHGSNDSSTERFFQAVSPTIAVIQVGMGNPDQHPREAALKRLKDAGAKIYRTDWDGSLIVNTMGKRSRSRRKSRPARRGELAMRERRR